MAKSKYDDLTKSELVEEVLERRAKDSKIVVDLTSNKAELITALVADDAESTPDPEPEPLHPDKLKLQAEARADGIQQREVPDDLHKYKGKYRYLETGEVFGLKILPAGEVRANKTHHAKSPMKFWDGTAEEFRQQFDKI